MNIPLLKKIMKAIAKEPRRLNMFDWVRYSDPIAPCGTAACIAGYAVILSNQKPGENWPKAAGGIKPIVSVDCVAYEGRKLLQLTMEETDRLFIPHHWPRQFAIRSDRSRSEQAEVTISRIKHFIKTKGEE